MWKSLVCCCITATKLALSNIGDENWESLQEVGLGMFNPPKHQRSERNSLSPLTAGHSTCQSRKEMLMKSG